MKSRFTSWLRHKRIAFDTSFLIPLLEDAKTKGSPLSRILKIVERKSIIAVTSTVTLLEILVRPYLQNERDKIDDYYGYLTRQARLELLPLTPEIADRAAELRARYGFKTPDAIQIATALEGGATLLLTQDKNFRKQKEIRVACF